MNAIERPNDLLSTVDLAPITARLAGALGLRFVEASPDHVLAEVTPADDYTSKPGIVHGGFLMAIADEVGGFATRVNLQPGQRTTTMESKTNFFRAASPGTLLRVRAEALHKGRTTMVWQTTISDGKGRRLSITTQTQLLITPGA